MLSELIDRFTNSEKSPVKPAGAPERDDVYQRCKKHAKDAPENHVDHDAYWTGADGVFYCHTCGDWFRTWGETDE